MKTADVLDQIDNAIKDWRVGPDAMRCNAPPEATRIVSFTAVIRSFQDGLCIDGAAYHQRRRNRRKR